MARLLDRATGALALLEDRTLERLAEEAESLLPQVARAGRYEEIEARMRVLAALLAATDENLRVLAVVQAQTDVDERPSPGLPLPVARAGALPGRAQGTR